MGTSDPNPLGDHVAAFECEDYTEFLRLVRELPPQSLAEAEVLDDLLDEFAVRHLRRYRERWNKRVGEFIVALGQAPQTAPPRTSSRPASGRAPVRTRRWSLHSRADRPREQARYELQARLAVDARRRSLSASVELAAASGVTRRGSPARRGWRSRVRRGLVLSPPTPGTCCPAQSRRGRCPSGGAPCPRRCRKQRHSTNSQADGATDRGTLHRLLAGNACNRRR